MITGTYTDGLNLPKRHLAGPFSGDKIFWHTDVLKDLRDHKIPPPRGVELDVTNVCNLRCPYCTNSEYNREFAKHLSFDVVSRVLAECFKLGVKAVTFTGGGEPLCHPRIGEMLNLAHEKGFDVALITNGTLFDRVDISDNALMRCRWIRVSLDAHNAESYFGSKGKRLFAKTLSNIKYLTVKKRNWEATTGMKWTRIGVGHLTYPANYEHLPAAADLVAKTGADYLQFRPVTFMPDDKRMQEYYGDESPDIMPYIEEARKHDRDGYRIFASTPKYVDINTQGRDYSFCYGVYLACVVGATGDVWVCCHMRGYQKFSLGNVYERPFDEIWNDAEHRNKVYQRIGDFRDCMPLCRFHGTNKILQPVNWEVEDENFM